LGGAFGAAAGAGGGAAAAETVCPLLITTNVCPHFGQRILSPVAGTRRSSTW
jgi:hypothetical protein